MTKLAEMLKDHLVDLGDTAEMVDVSEYIDAIDAEIYNAGFARQKLPHLREFAEEGGAAVIADRGQIPGLAGATVVLSALTLARLVKSVIAGEHARHAQRRPAASMLAGITPLPKFDEDLSLPPLAGDVPGNGLGSLDVGAGKQRLAAG